MGTNGDRKHQWFAWSSPDGAGLGLSRIPCACFKSPAEPRDDDHEDVFYSEACWMIVIGV